MIKPLTDAACRKFKPGRERRRIRDAGARSLFLVIEPSGHKAWQMRFRTPTGRIGKLTLGPFDQSGRELKDDPVPGQPLSLAAARQLAAKTLRERNQGRDPVAEHKARRLRRRSEVEQRAASTFAASVRDYIEQYAKRKTRNWRATALLLGLRYPATGDTKPEETTGGLAQRWAERLVGDLDDNDVVSVTDEARETGIPGIKARNGGTSEARERALHTALSAMLGWLKDKRRIKTNPCKGLERPAAAVRDRVLNADEIRLFWLAAESVDAPRVPGAARPFAPLLRLLLLSGARLNEVARMTRDEVHDDGTWHLAGSRTKNKKPHVVPLPSAARDLIASVAKPDSNFIFTTTRTSSVSGWSRIKKRLDAAILALAKKERGADATIPAWRLHDLRRTFVTGLIELGVPPHVVELVVNHVSGAKAGVAGNYNHSEMLPERRDALERWARFIGLIIDVKLHAAHKKFLNGGDDDANKVAYATFKAAIAEGGDEWSSYLKTLGRAKLSVVRGGRK